jgi:fibronectin type 3 domain-containing protein
LCLEKGYAATASSLRNSADFGFDQRLSDIDRAIGRESPPYYADSRAKNAHLLIPFYDSYVTLFSRTSRGGSGIAQFPILDGESVFQSRCRELIGEFSMRRINVLKGLLSGWRGGGKVNGRAASQKWEALDPLEARMLMAASIMSANYVTFAVDVTQAGTYSVDVYQSHQQFANKSITSLAVNAVVPNIPVVVHWATSPIEAPEGIDAASWNMNLAVGRNLIRVSKGIFSATLPANGATPAAPGDLVWTVDSSQTVQLAWTDNSTDETGYLIERRTGNGNWTVLTTVAPGSASFTDTSVATGSQYSYAVSAVNGTNSSMTTNVATAYVAGLPAVPAAPSALTVTVQSSTSVLLNWTDNSTNETGFIIEREVGGGSWAVLTTTAAGASSYTDTTVVPNNQYSYRVSATNSGGTSGPSNVVTGTTLAVTIPNSPSDLEATVQSSTAIDLTWTDNSDNETGFVIERQIGSGSWYVLTTTDADVTSFTDTTAVPKTQYSYQVSATNGAGTSNISNLATVTTPALLTIPAAPSNLAAAVQSATSILLTWSDNSTDETGFVIERRVGSGIWSLLATTPVGAANYIDTSAAESTQYSYRVSAMNFAGTSAASNVATATTPATIPLAPSNLALTVQSATSIRLTWTDNSNNETGFRIERQTGGGSWALLTTTAAGAISYTDATLAESTQYSYRVSATDSAGTSSVSNVATATTPATIPAAPSSLALTVQSSSSILLTWTDNSTNETGFRIERQTGSGSWTLLTTTAVGAISYRDATVAAGTQYSYRVSATNSAGTSSASNVATATTPVVVTVPAAPSNLALTVQSASSIRLTWTDNSSNETGFQIERQIGGGSWILLTTTAAGAISFTDTSVAASTQYSYRVSATNSAGTSSASNVVTGTTPLALNVWDNHSFASQGGSFEATFDAVPAALGTDSVIGLSGGAAGAYSDLAAIVRFNPSGTIDARNGGAYAAQNSVTYVAGTSYHFRLEVNVATHQYDVYVTPQGSSEVLLGQGYAFRSEQSAVANLANWCDISSVGGVTVANFAAATQAPTIPAAPSALTATAISSGQVNLAWTDNSSNETGFIIERRIGSGSWSVLTNAAAGATTYSDTTVAASTQYSYRVSATNGAGTSSPTNIATTTTMVVTIPFAPSGLALTVQSASSILLTWTDNSSNETGFLIERQMSGDSWRALATTAANVTSYSDATLVASTQYSYRVSATNSAGTSGPSNVATGTTLATGTGPILVPGTGWTGPTAQPAVQGNPTAAGYTQAENAIARWDVVPYQTFTGTFNVGVVAFNSSGIDHVSFAVNGGTWTTVSVMTANPQTANISGVGVNYDASGKGTYNNGVVEYWATLRASDFATDGPIEVRAIAYPKIGVPRVLDSLPLTVNGRNTLTALSLYVSPAGSDTTGDGTAGNPFATPLRAARYWVYAGNTTGLNNATIYLAAGMYTVNSDPYPHLDSSGQTGWVTIMPAPGVARSDVVVTPAAGSAYGSGIQMHMLRWKNVTFTGNAGDYAFADSGGNGSYLWFDGVNVVGPGCETGFQFFGVASHAGMYVTDSSVSQTVDGVMGATLSRNVYIHDILSDVFRETKFIVNCKADETHAAFYGTNLIVDATDNTLVAPDGYTPKAVNVDGGSYTFSVTGGAGWKAGTYRILAIVNGKWRLDRSPAAVGTTGGQWELLTGAHSDTNQWLNATNVNQIFYGLAAYYRNYSGISTGSRAYSSPLTDIAIVNCDILGLVNGNGIYMGGLTTNLYILNTDFGSGYSYWWTPGPTGFQAIDVVLENSLFNGDLALTGVTIR